MGVTSAFMGRDADLARLTELVEDRALVTVTGLGGIGKTRLADAAVSALTERFPGGILRADLSPLDTDADVGVAIAGQLGFSTPDAIALGVEGRRVLLFLDGCEGVLVGAALMASALLDQAPDLHLLATSRVALGIDGEQLLPLGPLAVASSEEPETILDSPAVQLYLDRARAAGAAWEGSTDAVVALGELCRRLDGIPLAIELAAARARTASPVELIELLDRRFELLVRRRGGPGRHESLRAVIDASYRSLPKEEQGVFRRLSVFAGSFTADLAHDVCAVEAADRIDTLDRLAGLVDRSLVVAEPRGGTTRYRLLDSLRDHAAQELAEAGEAAATRGTFVDRMVAEAESIVTDARQAWSAALMDRIADQFRNLAAALAHCLEHDDQPDRAYALLVPMYGAIDQTRFHEVTAAGRRVLERWPDEDGVWRWEAMAVVGMAALGAGDLDLAASLAHRCLDAGESAGALARLIAHRDLGYVARARGDLDAGVGHFRSARALAEERSGFARDLTVSEAAVVGSSGDEDAALATLARVVEEAEASGDPINETRARVVTAALLLRRGTRPEATAEIARIRVLADRMDYGWARGVACRLEASCVAMDGRWSASVTRWREALDQFGRSGDAREVALTLRLAAGAAQRTGQSELAAELMATGPPSDGVTVQPDLFEAELRELSAGAVAAAGPTPPVESVRRARALLADSDAEDRAAPAQGEPRQDASLVRTGEGWTATFRGDSVQLRHRKGIADLAVLLARDGAEVHCLELMGASDTGGDHGPGLDDRARREYQGRIRDLQQEIDEAREANDPVRADRAEQELDALVQQLSEAFGLSGRARSTGSPAEKARSAVTYRLRSAITSIEGVHPSLGRHLQNSIRTGTWCSYRPESSVVWEVDAGQGRSA